MNEEEQAAIPMELYWALAREQPTTATSTTTTTTSTTSTSASTLSSSENKQKRNEPSRIPVLIDHQRHTPSHIWNKISSSSSHLTIRPALSKKPSTKPAHPRQRKLKTPSSDSANNLPHSRSSFSFEHYINSDQNDHPSNLSNKTRSKFISADIVTSFFSSSKSHHTPHPKPSIKHLSKSLIHQPHPININQSISSSSLLLPLNPHSPKNHPSTLVDHQHHRYRSSSTSIPPIDLQFLHQDLQDDSPWSNRENFTHSLNARRPRDRHLLQEQPILPSSSNEHNKLANRRISSSALIPPSQNDPPSITQTSSSTSLHHQSLHPPFPPRSTNSRSSSAAPTLTSHPRPHSPLPLKPLDIEKANHLAHPPPDTEPPQNSSDTSYSLIQVPNTAPPFQTLSTPQSTHFSSSNFPLSNSSSRRHFGQSNPLRNRSLSDPFLRQTQIHYRFHPCSSSRHWHDIHAPLSNDTPLESVHPALSNLQGTERFHHRPHPDLYHLYQSLRTTAHPGQHTSEEILKLFEPRDSDLKPSSSRAPEQEKTANVLYMIDTPETKAALNVKADFVIGVAGPKGVGKSTIISKAIRKPPSSSHPSVTLYEDQSGNKITSTVSSIQSGTTGHSKTLQILEIDQKILAEKCIISHKNSKVSLNKEGLLSWPERLPQLDGVLLCYDAMDPKALDYLRPLLHSFWTRGGICLIVLACKSNKDEKLNATSPLKAAELVNVYGTGMIQLDGGLDDPSKKMRNSFNWIMKAIKEARGEHRSYSSASTCVLESLCSEEPPTEPSAMMTTSHLLTLNHTNISEKVNRTKNINVNCDEKFGFKKQRHGDLSPDHTPRKSCVLTLDLPSEDAAQSSQLSFNETESVFNQLDDADGDSFSNNALVAMSYEKSTRPDGSFKTEGQSSPSSSSSSEAEEPTLPTSPIKEQQQHQQQQLATALSPGDHKLSSSTTSPSLNENKSLSASGKHAAQKALIMSQRSADMDLHCEKHVVIDKFVFATVSGNEPSFVDHFIIIYRRFATPFDVLSALIARFEFVSGHLEKDPLLGRYAQLKICHVLMSWLETYPGDFVQTPTLTILKAFNNLMLTVTWLIHYAVEIMPMIKSLAHLTDEDAGWALPDCTDNSAVEKVLETLNSLRVSLAPHSARARESKNRESVDDQALPSTPHTTIKSMDGASSSIPYPISEASPHLDTFSSIFMSTDQVTSTAASSPLTAMNSYIPKDRHRHELSADQQSSSIEGSGGSIDSSEMFTAGTIPLRFTSTSSTQASSIDCKLELKTLLDSSHQLINLSEDSIALQITRLEWGIFSHIKPRHLIRYVLAPRDPNNPRKSLRDPNSPIAKSTEYLNYLAVWASSVILIQDKLKNRAKILLKLMKVAYELRDMDDFHSLMGVLAGIEAQPVYRLDATFDLVQHMDLQAYRRYLSLKKLMSSQRSFSAYRLARQTASSQCVPYLGTYLQDITAINEVKDDMKDGKVNLSKFLQISKSASTVINCNFLAPKVYFDKKVSSLIIKIPILSEDIQYDLSYKYKPRILNSHSNSNHVNLLGLVTNNIHLNPGSFIKQTTSSSLAIVTGSINNNNNNSNMETINSNSLSSSNTNSPLPPPLFPPTTTNTTTTTTALIQNPTTNSSTSHHSSSHLPQSHNTIHHHISNSATAINTSDSVTQSASFVAKKGTRKLKQLLNTAIHHHHHHHH